MKDVTMYNQTVMLVWPASDWFGAFAIFGWLMFIVVAAAFAFWLWMLIDLLQKKRFDDKLVWVLVLLFLNILGAILYYFLVKCCSEKGRRRR